jgi:hypothetical protein
MKNLLNNISYDIYLIVLLTLTFFSYTGHIQEYLLPLLVGIGVLCIIAKKSIFYIIPIPFFIQMSFSDLRDNVSVTTTYFIIFATLIILDIIINRKLTKKGYLSLPLLILSVVSMITHINSPDLFTTFAGFSQIFIVLGLYFYFINTLDKDEKNYEYVAKLLMYISVLVTFEMLYFIYQSGDLAIIVIRQRGIVLGWENLNIIIYANLIAIPLIGYLVSKAKIKLPYMIFALITILGIMLTLSRSSILTIGVFVAILIPVMLIIEKRRIWLIIEGLLFVLLLTIGVYYAETNYTLITDYIAALQSRDLTYFDDRLAILKIALEQLKLHPIFGSGGLYSSRVHLSEGGALNYHNTIAQASSLGIVGLLGFGYLFFRKTKLIMLSKSTFKWFALILIYVTAFVNGMLQPMYFYTTYMVFVFLVLAIVEVNETATLKG